MLEVGCRMGGEGTCKKTPTSSRTRVGEYNRGWLCSVGKSSSHTATREETCTMPAAQRTPWNCTKESLGPQVHVVARDGP